MMHDMAADRSVRHRQLLRPTRAVLVGAIALASITLAACGGSGDGDATSQSSAPSAPSAPSTTVAGRSTASTTSTAPTTTSEVASTTSTTSTTTSTSTTTTTTPVVEPQAIVLPQPVAPPTDERGYEPVIEMGTIEIPAIDVYSGLYDGIRLTTLDNGPGHWPGSAMPGKIGNTVIGGHRTSKNKVFRNLDQLVPGDEIIFDGVDGRHVYLVTGTAIIGPTDIWIIDQTPATTATLFACHPPGSTRQRVVVFAELAT